MNTSERPPPRSQPLPTPVRLDRLPRLAPTARQLYFAGSDRSEKQQIDLERRFFASLRMGTGVFKSTDAGRLDDLDELFARIMPPERPLILMDVAVSSGVTTADWMQSLARAGIEHEMVASDLCIRAWLFSLGHALHVLVDRNAYPLQYDLFGRGARTSSGKVLVDLCLAVPRRVTAALVCRHRRWRRDVRQDRLEISPLARAETVADGIVGLRKLLLTSSRLTAMANLTLLEENLLAEPLPALRRRFHVVRAANILNPIYFSERQLRQMIANLRCRLQSGGLLIVCHTQDDGINLATVFRLEADGGFKVIEELGPGVDVKEVVLETGT